MNKILYLLTLVVGFIHLFSYITIANEVYPTEKVEIIVETIAEGLNHPWAIEELSDNLYLVTERSGQLRLVDNGIISNPIVGVPKVGAVGQGGLLDVALSNNFEQSGVIYLTYSEFIPEVGFGTVLAKARLSGEISSARLENVEELFSMNKFSGPTRHFGSRIVVARDDTIFFSIGDRAESGRAQNMLDYAGAILRINPDGSVPFDNPYISKDWAYPEIWSKGHRNPQGLDIDPVTGNLYLSEHGAKGGDEINQSEAGKNYGWPIISYGVHYTGEKIGIGTKAIGFEQPLYYWDPSIAPGGLAVYRGKMFPEWDGDFLVVALKYQMLVRLGRDDKGEIINEERILEKKYGRMREIVVTTDGALLILTDEKNGKILKISRK